MLMKRLICLMFAILPLIGQSEDEFDAEAFESSLNYQVGQIVLGNDLATLNLPESFRYLNPSDTARVLTEGWGNPPGGDYLGMLFPADLSPLDAEGWGVVITYDESGFVKDEDATSIDFDELLADMKKDSQANNKERLEAGYGTVELIGWAEPPHYDASEKKLYWAKELAFDGNPDHILNYNIRVLGRGGVLELNAVSSMPQLALIKPQMEELVTITSFNQGNRYADFNPEIDKVAAYGIAGLIAGKVAAKAGFFKLLIAGLLAAKKFILFGIIAIGAFISKFYGKKRKEA